MLLTSFHIVSGTLGLISGGVAFYSQKGASVHRKSGIAFVISMLVMSATGAIIAAINSSQLSVIAGALTFYLVLTAYLTVQRPDQKKRILEIISLVIGSIVAASGLMLGVDAISSGDGQIDGKPAQVAVAFGGIAAIATLLDVKSLLWGSAVGKHRLLRHLWRMGVALLIATISFFLGQAQIIPEAIRHFAVIITPVLVVVLLLVYWIIRVQFFQTKLTG